MRGRAVLTPETVGIKKSTQGAIALLLADGPITIQEDFSSKILVLILYQGLSFLNLPIP